MKREFVRIKDKDYPRISDITLIGDWEEVSNIPAETIRPELGAEKLDGIIIKGYEMKWNVTNENGERYSEEAFDEFINEYFIAKKLNMPVDINHEGYYNFHAICGRVLYIERNTQGFYFAIYVPRKYEEYDALLWRLQSGIIQGFSKEGYATEMHPVWNEDKTDVEYWRIDKMKLLSVSLVSTPANGVPFEKMQEIKNSLIYITKEVDNKDKAERNTLEAMFNK